MQSQRSQHKAASKAMKALHELMLGPEEDVASMPMEQVNDILKSEGIDPTALIDQVKQKTSSKEETKQCPK